MPLHERLEHGSPFGMNTLQIRDCHKSVTVYCWSMQQFKLAHTRLSAYTSQQADENAVITT